VASSGLSSGSEQRSNPDIITHDRYEKSNGGKVSMKTDMRVIKLIYDTFGP